MKTQASTGFFIVEIMIALSMICYLAGIVAVHQYHMVCEHREIALRVKSVDSAVDFLEALQQTPPVCAGNKQITDTMEMSWRVAPCSARMSAATRDSALDAPGIQQMHVTVHWRTQRGTPASVNFVVAMPIVHNEVT